MKYLLGIFLKALLFIHSFLYSLIGRLAVKLEGGLHPKHRLMKYHDFFVENINDTDVVLDVGCGNGALSYDMAKKAKKVVGIDLNPHNITAAKIRHNADNIEYIVGDIVDFSFQDKFDIVVLSNVLEHIDRRTQLLLYLKSLTAKILIRIPMIDRDWVTVYRKELGLEYRLDKTHRIEYTLNSFKEELAASGLSLSCYYVRFGELYAIVTR